MSVVGEYYERNTLFLDFNIALSKKNRYDEKKVKYTNTPSCDI